MSMQNEVCQNEPLKNKVNTQTSRKIRALEKESESLQKNISHKKILQPREDFFPWLTEELRKLKAEDDFKTIGRK